MAQINVTVGTHHLALSESRIKHLLDGNNAAAQKMGWFDSLKDSLFHGGTKKEALEKLVAQFEEEKGLSALSRFEKIASYTDGANYSQFTIHITTENQEPKIEYRIKGEAVKQENISEQTMNVIDARIGTVFRQNDLDGQLVDWLRPHLKDTTQARKALTDAHFQVGGVHKRFDAASGILRAEDTEGRNDFIKETALANYANPKNTEQTTNQQELARYISTQRRIPTPEGLDTNKVYAEVDIYDRTQVSGGELDTQISSLSPREANSVLMQVVDMSRVFYKNDVSHRDLHMHNLMVYKPVDQVDSNITLKAIDFGKSKIGSDIKFEDKLTDIKYLFHKQATSALETLKRNNWRDPQSPQQMKHYPLHKLMAQCEGSALHGNQYDEVIGKIGDQLITHLKEAETIQDPKQKTIAIDYAFDTAMHDLGAVTDRLITPPQIDNLSHYIQV